METRKRGYELVSNSRDEIQSKEQESNSTGVVKDAFDRSFVGQPQELFKGNLLTKTLTLLIIIVLLISLSQCSL